MKIWVKESFVGFHKYKDAPIQVKFLRSIHRHLFHVKLSTQVFHDDREIEFFILKNQLRNYVRKHYEDKIVGSCEQIANQIKQYFEDKYVTLIRPRQVSVIVSEDDESGADTE